MDCLELLEPATILRNNQLGAPTQSPRVMAPTRRRGLDRFVGSRCVCVLDDRLNGGVETDRGKTVTKPLALSHLGLPLSEKQIPQVVGNLESGGKPKEVLETAALRPRQVRYQAALRPDILLL